MKSAIDSVLRKSLLPPMATADGGRHKAAVAVAFRYWRMLISANDGNADYVSMSVLNLVEGTTNRSFPARATGLDNGLGGADSALAAFNGTLDDEWVGLKANLPLWLSIDLGAEYAITKYQVASQRAVLGRTPSAWLLQGSNTSQTGPWTQVDSRTGQTGWGIQETREYTL